MPHLNRGCSHSKRVGASFNGITVLDFYIKQYPLATGTEWEARICDGLVLLNDEPTAPDTLIQRDQILTYNKPPWEKQDVPQNWTVLFEDVHTVAINKPSGLPVLPGGGFLDNTLLSIGRKTYPGMAPIHRLGQGTSGIVICARSDLARSRLTQAFRQRQFTKIYRTRVQGTDLPDEFEIHTPIGKIPYFEKDTLFAAVAATATDANGKQLGKPSESHCRVVHRDVTIKRSVLGSSSNIDRKAPPNSHSHDRRRLSAGG